jgi:hypothetical protein
MYISVGHDEYWSQGMRDNVEAFRNAGGNCLFMSANEVFWRIRYTDERTIWCYKDTMPGPGSHVAGTPLDPVTWTGTWRDTRRPGGPVPESLLTGTFFRMNGVAGEGIVVGYGTNAWAWMLSDKHRDGADLKLTACRQAQVNLFKDLGVSPASLAAGLTNPTPVALSVYGMTPPEPPDPPAPDVLSPWVLRGYGAAPATPYVFRGGDLVELFPQGGSLAG